MLRTICCLATREHDAQSERWANILNIVLLLPPAPAARVLLGRAFATLSARSAAALRRITVLGPPGGVGDEGRALLAPADGELTGDCGRGDDYVKTVPSVYIDHMSNEEGSAWN